jgi:hypothetical protein
VPGRGALFPSTPASLRSDHLIGIAGMLIDFTRNPDRLHRNPHRGPPDSLIRRLRNQATGRKHRGDYTGVWPEKGLDAILGPVVHNVP